MSAPTKPPSRGEKFHHAACGHVDPRLGAGTADGARGDVDKGVLGEAVGVKTQEKVLHGAVAAEDQM